jgi:serine phosphatase RsbU (regulator of sigma subunit)
MRLTVAPVAVVHRSAGSDADGALARVFGYAGALTSIPELDRAASGWGLVSVESEGGVIRRVPLVAAIEGTLIPGFGVETLRVALRVPTLRLFASGNAIDGVAIGDVFVAGERDGGARPHFSPRHAARFVSAIDVLEHRVDPDRLSKRIVLVGITALGLGESHATPLGESMPGSEIHAQLIENVFDGALLVRPAWAPAAEAAAFVGLGLVLALAIPSLPPRYAGIACVLGVAALLVTAYLALRYERRVLDALTPAAGLVLLSGVLLLLTLSDAAHVRRALERVLQAQREESARMAGELEAARRIQTATLPTIDVVRGDARLDLAVSMTPAREVGGDLYDFFWLDARRLFVVVGDVAGKGLSASIFMAVSKALCKSTTLRTHASDLGASITQANDEVSRDNPEMLFVTAVAAVLDVETGEIAYCNAGHEHPLVANAGGSSLRSLDDGGGPPLCVLEGFDYRGAHDRLQPGDVVCIVSDGITEAEDASGVLFGSARVGEVLRAACARSVGPQAIVDGLRGAVRAFTGDVEPADDATVFVLRWNGPSGVSEPGSRPAG